jgi:hypothetical protein
MSARRSDIGGLLVRVTSVAIGKPPCPERGIHLGNHGMAGGNLPAVERPEMHVVAALLPKEAQPLQAGVCGLGHRALHVEKKYGLRRRRPGFRQSQPSRIARAFAAFAADTFADEIHLSVVFVHRPMALEIVEKLRPIRGQAMGFKIAHWKRKAVVNPDNRCFGLGQFIPQPLGNPTSRPIFARAEWRRNLPRFEQPVGGIHPQP